MIFEIVWGLDISFCMTTIGSIFGLLSAWYWFRSSRKPFKSKRPFYILGRGQIHFNPSGMPLGAYIDGHPVPTEDEIAKFVKENSGLNAKAAMFTGCAVLFGVFAAMLDAFGL